MQPLAPPERIRQAVEASGAIDDHTQALVIVDHLHAVTSATEARATARRTAAFLDGHMAAEEARDGVFDWLRALDSALGPELERLVEEHRRIREALAALDSADDDTAVSLAHALGALLERHEAAERTALDRALHRG